MGFYSRVVFPCLCERVLNRPFITRQREMLLAGARGEVLEIGFGTGLNLPHYPSWVRKLTVIDPNPGMHRRARRRIQAAAVEIRMCLLRGEELPFETGVFDCVVSTFTLCSIANVEGALAEVYRVLKPGGQFLALEHGLSPHPAVQKWQHRLTWLQRRLADNCHLNRNIRQLVTTQAFERVEIDEFYLERTPRSYGYLYRGTATK